MFSLTASLLAVLLFGQETSAVSSAPPADAGKVVSISFLSSHRVLADHADNYRRGGKMIEGPEWTPVRDLPITQTGGTRLEATVVLRADAAVPGETVRVVARVQGKSRLQPELLVGTGVHRNCVITARVGSARPLPKGIYREALTLDWLADTGQGLVAMGTTGPHVIYVTLGQPTSARDPDEDIVHRYPAPLPPGVTIKRMEAAMALVRKANAEATTDTHALIGKLMELFPGFLLAKGSHYVNDMGGAWPLADAVAESGECQAIVRLVKAVLDMVGAPGQLALVKLYADPDDPTTPIELPWGAERTPPPQKRMKLVAMGDQRRGWGIALLTQKPEFPDEDEAKPAYGNCWKVGPVAAVTERSRFLTEKPNNFQGALKATAAGTTRYYGGGIGGTAFACKEELFGSAFWGMVWTMLEPFPKPERPGWDEHTAAAMKRVGVSAPSPSPGPAAGRKDPNPGFRMMEIIHIYDDDRCR